MSLYLSSKDAGRVPSVGVFAAEGRDPAQPLGGVVPVIGMLRRLDMIEKAAIDDGLTGGSDGSQERGRARGVGARDRGAPEPQPMGADPFADRFRHTVQKSRLIQQGMADPAIAPVEQDDLAVQPTEIAWMEIAMNEAIAETAG